MNEKPTSEYKPAASYQIPQDWKLSTVGDEFDVQLGKMLDNEKNIGTLKPYIGNRAVQWNRIDVSELPLMAMTAADLQRYRLFQGDLLVCEGGEVGRAAIWDEPLPECYYQKALHRLRPRRNFNSELMAELLRYWSDHGLLANYVTQTSIAHLTRKKFVDVPLPVPPISEQLAIASALSDVNSLISGLNQLIAKKRDLKHATMQQLLSGLTRLPGFSGDFEETVLGNIIERIIGGGTPSRTNPNFWEGDIPWVTVKDFATFNPTRAQESITKEGLQNSASNLIPRGTLITSTRMALGKAVIYDVDVSINQDLKAIFTKPILSAKYLFFWFQFYEVRIDSLGSGSTVKGISLSTLKKIRFQLPTLSEQTAIATLLSDMDAELAALEARRDKTRALKEGMMQDLLTGRIRLINANDSGD